MAAVADDGVGDDSMTYSPLKGEQIFVLDAVEATRASYGYAGNASYRNKRGQSNFNKYWLRSPGVDDINVGTTEAPNMKPSAGIITDSGNIATEAVTSNTVGYSPAFNLKSSSILFTELGEDNSNSSIYDKDKVATLTLLDNDASFTTKNDYKLKREENGDVKLSFGYSKKQLYSTTGGNTYTNISLLVTDGEYNDLDAEIKQYSTMPAGFNGDSSEEDATATFTLNDFNSEEWENYHVYVFAECINAVGDYVDHTYTDFATTPQELTLRKPDYTIEGEELEEEPEEIVYDGQPHMNSIEFTDPVRDGNSLAIAIKEGTTEKLLVQKRDKRGRWQDYTDADGVTAGGVTNVGEYKITYTVTLGEALDGDKTIYLPTEQRTAYLKITQFGEPEMALVAKEDPETDRYEWFYGDGGSTIAINAPKDVLYAASVDDGRRINEFFSAK